MIWYCILSLGTMIDIQKFEETFRKHMHLPKTHTDLYSNYLNRNLYDLHT